MRLDCLRNRLKCTHALAYWETAVSVHAQAVEVERAPEPKLDNHYDLVTQAGSSSLALP